MSSGKEPLLSVRATLVLLSAFVVGLLAGLVAYFVERSLAGAVMVGGASAGAAVGLFHQLVG